MASKGLSFHLRKNRPGTTWEWRVHTWNIQKQCGPLRFQVVLPSGLRRWFRAPVTSVAWVRIPPLSKYSLNILHDHTNSVTIAHYSHDIIMFQIESVNLHLTWNSWLWLTKTTQPLKNSFYLRPFSTSAWNSSSIETKMNNGASRLRAPCCLEDCYFLRR